MSLGKVVAGSGWRYYTRDVVTATPGVGHGQEHGRVPGRGAGVLPGVWTGSGLPALGLAEGAAVTVREAELLFGHGRHPCADELADGLLAAGRTPREAGACDAAGPRVPPGQRGP